MAAPGESIFVGFIGIDRVQFACRLECFRIIDVAFDLLAQSTGFVTVQATGPGGQVLVDKFQRAFSGGALPCLIVLLLFFSQFPLGRLLGELQLMQQDISVGHVKAFRKTL